MNVASTPFSIVDIDSVWASLAARLPRTRTRPSTLAHLRLRCQDATAVCLAGPDGVIVLGAEGRPDGTLRADMLLGVSVSSAGAFKRNEGAMLAIARDLGAAELSFRTDRRGWARLLGPEWVEHEGTFTRATAS